MASFLLVIAAAGGLYWYSLWRHPKRICRRCGGSKRHDDSVFGSTFGNCLGCGGSGYRIRWGTRLFLPGTYQKIQSGEHGRNF
jgi:hypothetical protein